MLPCLRPSIHLVLRDFALRDDDQIARRVNVCFHNLTYYVSTWRLHPTLSRQYKTWQRRGIATKTGLMKIRAHDPDAIVHLVLFRYLATGQANRRQETQQVISVPNFPSVDFRESLRCWHPQGSWYQVVTDSH